MNNFFLWISHNFLYESSINEWDNNNNIYNYETLTKEQLKDIKASFNNTKIEYTLYNTHKITEIGKSIRNLEKKRTD